MRASTACRYVAALVPDRMEPRSNGLFRDLVDVNLMERAKIASAEQIKPGSRERRGAIGTLLNLVLLHFDVLLEGGA